ncbi:hypothetical protein GWK47_051855 [Chionoecetes opilio]|uniref:Uncharacterized protein n=1 Tax=Chionoecetes opilio TaxID=41210 RepID=A0A8J4Y9H1_CHIOP|nr:hypothetical protein GWK47_051855 [Chionoecetes opilio]
MHQARWMSKVLYSFKIWMFRGQFRLTKKEERGLQRLCLFVVRVYAKAWIEASFSVQAPRLDLELIKALGTYDKIDPEIGDVALSKLSSHLWYVSEELVGLSFFDSDVSCETKNGPWLRPYDERNLTERTRLRKESRFQRSRSEISTWKTSSVDVLSTSSGSYTWMRPSSICHRTRGRWTRGFQRSSQIVRNLAVVNDHAERGVALIQEFNGSSQRMRSSFSSSFKWWRTTGRPSRTRGSPTLAHTRHSEEPGKHDTPPSSG